MEPYHGICPTCGAYMGRGDGNRCGDCRAERFAGEGAPSAAPAAPSPPRITHHKRLDPTQSAWVVTHEGDARSFAEQDDAMSWAGGFGLGCVVTLPAVEWAP